MGVFRLLAKLFMASDNVSVPDVAEVSKGHVYGAYDFCGESIGDVFRGVGGQIRDSWCGPCFGQGPDSLAAGQRAITTFNRNWQNRMGRGGEGFLASPAVVAASALLGYMAPPSELGLDWDAERFGV